MRNVRKALRFALKKTPQQILSSNSASCQFILPHIQKIFAALHFICHADIFLKNFLEVLTWLNC